MKRCILKDVPITPDNDSKAHVIPSALGGRLKPTGILCREANTELGDKFDLGLIESFRPFIALVDGSRDKSGSHAPIRAKDEDGIEFEITAGSIELVRPQFHHEAISEGSGKIQIVARTEAEARQLLGRAKSLYPELDIEEAMKLARKESAPVGTLGFQMQLGPISAFPGIFVMAAVFAAYNEQSVHPKFKPYVENFDVSTPTLPPDTFYFLHKTEWSAIVAEVGHQIVLFCDAARKQAIFYARLFNQPGIAVVMPFTESENACFSYGVDVLKGTQIPVIVDSERLLKLDWKETHKNGDSSLMKAVETAGRPLIELAHQLDFDRELKKILE